MWLPSSYVHLCSILIIYDICLRCFSSATSVLRVQNLSKLYKSRWFLQGSSQSYALKNITTIIPRDKIVSFIGPSGSGKSTLVKCIVGMESINGGSVIRTNEVVTTNDSHGPPGYVVDITEDSKISYCYLDPHFYLSYNDNTNVHELLKQYSCKVFLINSLVDAIIAHLKLPTDVAASSLLISQQKTFEILLGLCRIEKNPPYVVVFDEYFDKDHSTVLSAVMKNLRVIQNDFNVDIQMFIVTHSKSVYQQHSDYTIALYKGMIYDSGHPTRVKCPAQMTWVDAP